ncbi:MAG TPA: leucine-rich repeat protein [Bacteroidales bacterium]|nr:leucine-rich repeat protein [Bacteroidales bacterium]
MRKRVFYFISLILFCISSNAKSQDFYALNNHGDTIYYNITSSTAPYIVEVTYKGNTPLQFLNEYSDTLDIPISAVYNDTTYIVKSIRDSAFCECGRLKCITIGDSITSIARNAFNGCIRLSLVNFNAVNCGDLETFIPLFENCISLTAVNVGNNVNRIPGYAFWSSDIRTINFGNSVREIGNNAFQYCPNLTSVTIPGSVNHLARFAFADCVGIVSVSFEEGFEILNDGVFQNCTSISSISLPNSLLRVGGFNNCRSLTSVEIPNSVTSFGYYAFDNCINLKSITIPSGVTFIGNGAFESCTGLDSIISKPINPIPVADFVFWGVNKSIPIYVPCESLSLYQNAPEWDRFTNYRCLLDVTNIDNNNMISCSLYPNPTEKETKLEIEGLTDDADIFVLDLNGRILKTYKYSLDQKQLIIDVSGFAKGIYSIKVNSSNFNTVKKIVVN